MLLSLLLLVGVFLLGRSAYRRQSVVRAVLAGALLFLAVPLLLARLSPADSAGAPATSTATAEAQEPSQARQYDVRYEVEGSCGSLVTYEALDGMAQRQVGASWWYARNARRGDILTLSAQLDCRGSITVRVLRSQNGEWVTAKEVTSAGEYVIASTTDVF